MAAAAGELERRTFVMRNRWLRVRRSTRPVHGAVRPALAVALLAVFLASGCRSVRPVTCYGHDLVENPGHVATTRFVAGIGTVVGYVVAFPAAVLLVPSVWSDASVENADSPRPTEERPAGSPDDRRVGDHRIPLALAPFEYGGGLGAAVLGAPAEWLARPFVGYPPPPPGEVEEPPGPDIGP